jgi:hypothetical protein
MHRLAPSPARPMPKARRPRWRALELALQYPAATLDDVHALKPKVIRSGQQARVIRVDLSQAVFGGASQVHRIGCPQVKRGRQGRVGFHNAFDYGGRKRQPLVDNN